MGAVRVIDQLSQLADVTGVGGLRVGTRAARPAPASVPAGTVYLAEDTGEIFLRRSAAVTWIYLEGAKTAACSVSYNAQTDTPASYEIAGGFVNVVLPTVRADFGSNYNPATGIFTCPVSGFYDWTSKLRFTDQAPSGIGFGHGVYSSANDNPAFQWFSTLTFSEGAHRQGSTNTYTDYYAAGTQLRMIAFTNTALTVMFAATSIALRSS